MLLQPRRTRERHAGALGLRRLLAIRPAEHRARAHQDDVVRAWLHLLPAARGQEFVGAHRLVRGQALDAERRRDVEHEAARDQRRQLGRVLPQRPEIAEPVMGAVAAMPFRVVAAGHVRKRVDVRAGVGRAHQQFGDEAEIHTVIVEETEVPLVALSGGRAVGQHLERRMSFGERHARPPARAKIEHLADPRQRERPEIEIVHLP